MFLTTISLNSDKTSVIQRSAVLAYYLTIAIILLCVLFSWFVIDPLKYSILTELNTGHSLKEAVLAGIDDYALRLGGFLVIILGVVVVLFRLEWRQGSLSAALQMLPDRYFYFLSLVILLWLIHSYFFPGHILGGDASSHIVRLIHFGSSLQKGEVSFWNNYFYMGSPFLQFYPPLFCWLGGGLYALIHSADWAVKLLLLILHAASGILFFLFLRIVGIGRLAALLCTIAYAGAWAHGQLIWYQGVLPQALTMALLPAAFLLAERMLHSEQPYGWNWTGFTLVSAAMLIAHQPHGMFSGIYVGVYLLFRQVMEHRGWRPLLAIATAGMLGVLMALFVIVPYWLERDYVMASAGAGLFHLRLPDAQYFHHLLVWRNTSTTQGAETAAYVGLSTFLLAGVAAVNTRTWRRDGLMAKWNLLILAALLVSMIWRGALVRDIIYTLFFLSALAAAGAQQLLDRFPNSRSLPAILLLIVFIDVGTTALQPLPRTDKAFMDTAGAYLAKSAANERVMLTTTGRKDQGNEAITADVGPNGNLIQYYPVQTVGGPHNHTATHVHNFAVTIIERAQQELRKFYSLSPETRSLLAMLNVSRIVNSFSNGMGLPESYAGSIEEPPLGRVISMPEATPVLFAPGLIKIVPPAGLEKPLVWSEHYQEPMTAQALHLLDFIEQVRQAMLPVPAQRRAARIPVQELPVDAPPLSDSHAGDRIRLDSYRVTGNTVHLAVTTDSPGFLQLAHPWYPLLQVKHNGVLITPLKSTLGLLVVPAVAGSNSIEIQPSRSAIRIVLGALGWGGLLAGFLIPWAYQRRLIPNLSEFWT
ncbi:MAG: hypothetical protein U1F76_09295 [Candidatus Competibacteraceae bacterium]